MGAGNDLPDRPRSHRLRCPVAPPELVGLSKPGSINMASLQDFWGRRCETNRRESRMCAGPRFLVMEHETNTQNPCKVQSLTPNPYRCRASQTTPRTATIPPTTERRVGRSCSIQTARGMTASGARAVMERTTPVGWRLSAHW